MLDFLKYKFISLIGFICEMFSAAFAIFSICLLAFCLVFEFLLWPTMTVFLLVILWKIFWGGLGIF